MSTLHEDEMFTSDSAGGGLSTAHLSPGLPPSRFGAPHSPALSLDSLYSAAHRAGGGRLPPQAPALPASPGTSPRADEPVPAWWAADQQERFQQEPHWGAGGGEPQLQSQPTPQHSMLSQGLQQAAGMGAASGYDAGAGAADVEPLHGFAPHDMKTSPQKLETASFSPHAPYAGSSGSSVPGGPFGPHR